MGVYYRKIMNGMSANIFGPNNNLTRAETVQLLYNYEGNPPQGPIITEVLFHDCENTEAWYFDAVRWARWNGIVSGYSYENFGPNDSVTREQFAVMLRNYKKFTYTKLAGDYSTTAFNDNSKISSWAKDAVQWASDNKIVNGYTDKTFRPQNKITRAEAATMMMNYIKAF